MEIQDEMDGGVYRSTVVALDEEDDANSISSSQNGPKVFIKRKVNSWCSRKTLEKRLPVVKWLPEYRREYIAGDLIAGITVGLMTIPQALAYGIVAGLPPNYGLYAAFIGGFTYCIFGSTKELNIGPTAIMALMTLHYTSQGGPDFAVLLCFVSGVIELLAGIINLGFMINFISQPVISGFTSAAAITIASSQLKSLFGLSLKKTPGLLPTWINVFKNIKDTRWQDATLGISCIVVLTIMKELRAIKWKCFDKNTKNVGQRIAEKLLFFLSVGRNAIVVIIISVMAFFVDGSEQPFTLTGNVTAGVPPPSLPPFTSTVNNQTMSFLEIMSDVGIGVVMIPFIAVLDNIAIVGAFSEGKIIDATQEIIAVGFCNLFGSFFGSFPVTGSLSRTAVSRTSGVRSPLAAVVTSVMVLLALAFLTPFFKFIPKACLAAVIMCAVMHMVDYEIVMPLWRSKKIDMVPLSVTFFACLFWGLEWGILLGIGVNLSLLLFSIATPTVRAVTATPKKASCGPYILVTPAHGLRYPSISHVRAAIQKIGVKQAAGNLPVVIDCTFLKSADYTSARGIKGMVADFSKRLQPLVFANMNHGVVRTVSALQDIVVCQSMNDIDEVLIGYHSRLNAETIASHEGTNGFVDTTKMTSPASTPGEGEASNPLLTMGGATTPN